MSYVTVNALTVPADHAEGFAERFANRPGKVDQADGFERFELLRPADGKDLWLVVTHWRDQDAYEAWSAARTPRSETLADAHEVWAFDVIQQSAAA
ncbi:MAG: antibiotic biosynthesis monooxygenase [Micrococcales bacterium]|nr:antibiotic biosynthesis monooxygenase [Micrococcales bacterium]